MPSPFYSFNVRNTFFHLTFLIDSFSFFVIFVIFVIFVFVIFVFLLFSVICNMHAFIM